jgi:hypothetical protein
MSYNLIDAIETGKREKAELTQEERELAEPETLYEFAARVQDLRKELLLAGSDGLGDFTEQHLILALDGLSSAAAQLRLAGINQARALAGNR